jgi:hypothetical protein
VIRYRAIRMARWLAPALLVCTVASAASFGPAPAGLKGRIQEGPTCPVERTPPDPQCAPRPISATLRIRPADNRSEYIQVHSDKRGRFTVELVPGTYVVHPLRVHGSEFPRPPAPFKVTIHAQRFTHITVTYDTGIR